MIFADVTCDFRWTSQIKLTHKKKSESRRLNDWTGIHDSVLTHEYHCSEKWTAGLLPLICSLSRWWPSGCSWNGIMGLLLKRKVPRPGYRDTCKDKDTCSNTLLKLIRDKHADLPVSAAVKVVHCSKAAQDLKNCSLTGSAVSCADNKSHPWGMWRD